MRFRVKVYKIAPLINQDITGRHTNIMPTSTTKKKPTLPNRPEGIRLEELDLRPGCKQIKFTWLEDRGSRNGSSPGRGSPALMVFMLGGTFVFFLHQVYTSIAEGNKSALFLAIIMGAVLFPTAYALLLAFCNQRIVILDSKWLSAIWRPFPGLDSWKKPISNVTRLSFEDYCLYAEFSDRKKRLLLPMDLSGEKHEFVKARIEKELGLIQKKADVPRSPTSDMKGT